MLVTVYFHAQDNSDLVEFQSTADTELKAREQGRLWAEASGFKHITAFLVSPFVPPGIHNITRKAR